MSHLRSGTIKYITPEVLNGLKKSYKINPKYITHGASNMFDVAGAKYEHFDNFVDNWDLVEHENKNYLHFTMDENFYNFLIEVYNLKEASSKSDDAERMAEAFQKALDSCKENFTNSNTPKEYVLIPADVMFDIAQDNINRRKALSEVVDILNFYPKKIKIKKGNGADYFRSISFFLFFDALFGNLLCITIHGIFISLKNYHIIAP